MQVKMLTAMAGASFSHLPGEIVDVKKKTADAWIKAGIAVKASGNEAEQKKIQADMTKVQDANRDLVQEITSLKEANATLTDARDEAVAKLEAAEKAAADGKAGVSAADQARANAERRLKELEGKSEPLEEVLSETEEKLEAAQARIAELETETASLLAQLNGDVPQNDPTPEPPSHGQGNVSAPAAPETNEG